MAFSEIKPAIFPLGATAKFRAATCSILCTHAVATVFSIDPENAQKKRPMLSKRLPRESIIGVPTI